MYSQVIIVMGVSGCGKTTIGKIIADVKRSVFVDGDDLHPQTNIKKMQSGIPLNDEDRNGWFEHIIAVACRHTANNSSCVIACSALKRKYRDVLRAGIQNISFVFLKASYEKVYQQMVTRKSHFMPMDLLKSQFDTLEEPAADEKDVITIAVSGGLKETAAATLQGLG
ncbi:MAG TPA: gluconokinase [Niabella sp.]|nr:gluconokinase [Niabella sp.]